MSTAVVSSNTKGGGKSGGGRGGGDRRGGHHNQSNNNSTRADSGKHHEKHSTGNNAPTPKATQQQQASVNKEAVTADPHQGIVPTTTHPLNRRWTLWYDSPSTYNTENWELSLVPVMTIATVEDFFVMLRYMKPLHDLRTSSQYHFFQDGVKPMWEDPANKEGGKIWVNLEIPAEKKGAAASANNNANSNNGSSDNGGGPASNRDSPVSPNTAGKSELDRVWERVLMGLIGEYLEPSADLDKKEGGGVKPQIIGCVMAKRKYHNRLALWVRDARNTAAIETLKRKLKEEVALPTSASLVFTQHGESGGKN